MDLGLPAVLQMLRIRRSEDDGFTVFALSGRVEEGQLPELRGLLETEARATAIMLDLEEVRLVDRETVGFLAACEARGIKLKNCPSYVRKWIETGSDQSHEPRC